MPSDPTQLLSDIYFCIFLSNNLVTDGLSNERPDLLGASG